MGGAFFILVAGVGMGAGTASVIVNGPLVFQARQVFFPGPEVGAVFFPGPEKGDVFFPGPEAGQVKP